MTSAADTALHDRNDRTEALTLLQCAAVAEWYEALTPRLLTWLRHQGAVAERMAEDIIQDTFVRAIGKAAYLATFTPNDRRNYVFRIAANLLKDHQRRPPAAHAVPTSAFHDDADDLVIDTLTASNDWTANATQMEQTTASRMTLIAIWRAVPVEQRELLLMVVYGYSYGEMMTHFGIQHDNLRLRIHRLRKRLRAMAQEVA